MAMDWRGPIRLTAWLSWKKAEEALEVFVVEP